MNYALIDKPTEFVPIAEPKKGSSITHIECGTKMEQVPEKDGRYFCVKCLRTGYLAR